MHHQYELHNQRYKDYWSTIVLNDAVILCQHVHEHTDMVRAELEEKGVNLNTILTRQDAAKEIDRAMEWM